MSPLPRALLRTGTAATQPETKKLQGDTMSNKDDQKRDDRLSDDPLADTSRLISQEVPPGVDRRSFLIRSAVGGAAAVMTGRVVSAEERTAMAIATMPPQLTPPKPAATPPPLSPDLEVVKKGAGPVLTTVDEFYKVGPGPSSSHTIGPMRITYDFYQRAAKLPADQLAKATAAQGQPVRKPQRHRKGTRHRTGRTGGTGRKRAGDRRPEISRQLAGQA